MGDLHGRGALRSPCRARENQWSLVCGRAPAEQNHEFGEAGFHATAVLLLLSARPDDSAHPNNKMTARRSSVG